MAITKRYTGMTAMMAPGILLAAAIAASANDWPQWRGQQRTGISGESGLLTSWPAGGPALAWKITDLGAGYSGVAVAGGRVYTMGDTKDGCAVFALEEKTGKPIWSVKLGQAGAPGWGGFAGPRCTPAVDGSRLYVAGHYGELACLETADGKTVWQKHLVKDLGGSLPEWGFSESPLVDGETVLYTPGGDQGAVVALNKLTGEVVWRTKDFTDKAHYSSILIAELAGSRQYVQLTDQHVVGIAPQTGKILWKAPRQGKVAVIPTPVCKDDMVFVTSGYGVGCNMFKVTKSGDTFQATQVYANRDLENHHGGVVLIGDHLYGHSESKGLVCMDLKTGKLAWSEKGKAQKGSICAVGGQLYYRFEDGKGTLLLLDATPGGYVEKGRFDQPERSKKNSWPHPVIANGRLYVRDQDLLLCYELKGS